MNTDLLQPEGGWAGPAQARLEVPPPSQRGLLFRTASRVSHLFDRPELPAVFPLLHRNPRLFWGWLFFASRLMPWGRLAAPARELLILRTAWLCRSRYEWGQHVEIAERVGVADRDILAVTRGPEAFSNTTLRTLIQACDELHQADCLSDDTWRQLQVRHNDSQLLEIMMLVGHYRMLAGVLISCGLPLEARMEDNLKAFYARIRALIQTD
ncbi:hypothetical protein S7S_17425 [Isoalcanivorax pacificus W11-5]|uniref:Carboxymuconolactone decarboxylase-like domain-containing protein n=1 Tax=Isoalcanivorax pacificus W11-5 TaxID=391936 RepID=A0A0B4XUF2_9GAMM|nr:carboxymuconolactone decarboxylase family protein [Isoalcanivorax pacificus]AJD49897.1 hypothetical protein S7S_17425 [Isoalcanivorax pacificus W11-5]